MPGYFDDLSDEELMQSLQQGQPPVASPSAAVSSAPIPAPSQQSDEELMAHLAADRAKLQNGKVYNSENGSEATPEQTAYLRDQYIAGKFNPKSNEDWGTEFKPLLGVEGGAPRAGQWYVDLKGNKIQAPSEMNTDQGLGVLQGVLQPFNKAAGWLDSGAQHIPGYNEFNQWSHDNLGTAISMDAAKAAQQDYFDRQAEQGHIPGRGGHFVGNVLGTIPAALVAPEGLAGALVTGGLSGALLSKHDDLGGMALDSGLGALTGGTLHGAGSLISKAPIMDTAKQALYQMGVPLTPGQIAGYPEQLVSKFLPFAGGAAKKSFDGFDTGAGNVVLEPLGGRIPKNIDPSQYIPKQITTMGQTALKSGDRDAMAAVQEAAQRYANYSAARQGGAVTPGSLYASSDNPAMSQFATYGSKVMGDSPPTGHGGFGIGAILGDGLIGNMAENAAGNSLSRIPILHAAGNAAKAGAVLYSPPGRAVFRGVMMGDRPPAVQSVGDIIRSKLGGLFGTSSENTDNYFPPSYGQPQFDQGY